ncbi:2669_t:CDS:2 [Funneliformis mosseae]|uniref:2669_t:CDS:1 n=1 Tax=Funneliformis mosseae TaxID=27381 RepID=A0A9N9H4T0_FUNMO|nr:2669_t:CDS:2 [Funneliformis mosseae]
MSNQKRGVYEEGTQDTSFRRTWDKEEFKRRARERSRIEREKEEEEDRKRKGLKPKNIDSSEAEPARELLRARTEKVVLDANLNKVQVVQSTNIASKQPDQRALGMSMKVERSTLDQVKNRLENLKKKQEPQEYDLDARVEQLQKQEEEEKRRRKERKKAKKRGESSQNTVKEEDSPENEVNPEMAKFMGFVGFGSTKS